MIVYIIQLFWMQFYGGVELLHSKAKIQKWQKAEIP